MFTLSSLSECFTVCWASSLVLASLYNRLEWSSLSLTSGSLPTCTQRSRRKPKRKEKKKQKTLFPMLSLQTLLSCMVAELDGSGAHAYVGAKSANFIRTGSTFCKTPCKRAETAPSGHWVVSWKTVSRRRDYIKWVCDYSSGGWGLLPLWSKLLLVRLSPCVWNG